jgi:acetyl-CoA carboxylase biotin carboxyl carrier protein
MSVRAGPSDGRIFRRLLVAASVRRQDGRVEQRSPAVGLWRNAPPPGTLVVPGATLGQLEILGVLHELVAGDTAHGIVLGEAAPSKVARVSVEHGQLLLVLDPSAGAVLEVEREAEALAPDGGLAFRSPSSGRFYRRPSPDKPAFVEVGATVEEGQTVCLLEIMKTFHRIAYGGTGLPKRAKVVAIVHDDGADVETGDVLLRLEGA